MSRRVIAFLLALSCSTADVLSQGRHEDCGGPTSSIRITAQQLSLAPPTYAFLVTNLMDATLQTVVIGKGDSDAAGPRIFGFADNIPTSVRTPAGWLGETIRSEEGAYVTFVWRAIGPASGIGAGQSASGFFITLPAVPSTRPPQLFEGMEATQTSFDRVPFLARLTGGRCVWGFTGTDLLRR